MKLNYYNDKLKCCFKSQCKRSARKEYILCLHVFVHIAIDILNYSTIYHSPNEVHGCKKLYAIIRLQQYL